MPDSLAHSVDTIVVKQIDNYELLNNVNEFYDSAWSKLIVVGSVAFAIVGIIVPLIIQWYQKRILKVNEEQLTDHINSRIATEVESLKKIIEAEVAKQNQAFEKRIKKLGYSTTAQTLHLQAMVDLGKNRYNEAYASLVKGIKNYLMADDVRNLSTLINGVVRTIPSLTKEYLVEARIKGADLEKIIPHLEKIENPLLEKAIQDLKIAFFNKMK